jgi:hypothetical protein
VPDHLLDAFAGAMDEMVRYEVAGGQDQDVERATTAIRVLAPAFESDGQLEQEQVSDLVHRVLAVIAVVMRRIALEHSGASESTADHPVTGIAPASESSSARADELLARNHVSVSSTSPHRAAFAHALDALDALEVPVPAVFYDAFAGAARNIAEAEHAGVPGVDGAAAERAVLVGLRLDCEAEEASGIDEARGLELSQMTLAIAILILRRMAQETHGGR